MSLVLLCLVLTVYLSYHVTTVLFGDNSLQVYNSLKYKKEYLEDEILRLQKVIYVQNIQSFQLKMD